MLRRNNAAFSTFFRALLVLCRWCLRHRLSPLLELRMDPCVWLTATIPEGTESTITQGPLFSTRGKWRDNVVASSGMWLTSPHLTSRRLSKKNRPPAIVPAHEFSISNIFSLLWHVSYGYVLCLMTYLMSYILYVLYTSSYILCLISYILYRMSYMPYIYLLMICLSCLMTYILCLMSYVSCLVIKFCVLRTWCWLVIRLHRVAGPPRLKADFRKE